MSSLSERIDAYAALPPDERAAVADEVAASGSADAASRLARAQGFAALLDEVCRPDPPVSPDDVAAYLTDRAFGIASPDDERVRAAIAADAALQAEADRMQGHLDALHTGAESPLARFERLSGHRLVDASDEAPPHRLHRDPRAARTRPPARAAERTAAVPSRTHPAAVRRMLVAATVVLVAYGGLFYKGPELFHGRSEAGRARLERSRVADLGDLASYAPPTMRGAETDALPARLDQALDAVAGARRSTLGLFPRYDASALDAAAAEIAAIAGAADAGSAVSQEARLALARVYVSRGRDAEAVRVLGGLVHEQGYRGPEARRLLDFIRTQDGA